MSVYCIAAVSLTCVFLSCFYVIHKKSMFNQYKGSLTGHQKDRYFKIVKERSNIFYKSVIISILVASILGGVFVKYGLIKVSILPCFYVAVTLFLTCVLYQLFPKSDYMIKHLNTEKQRMNWLEINKSFRKSNYYGLLIGIFIYIIIICII